MASTHPLTSALAAFISAVLLTTTSVDAAEWKTELYTISADYEAVFPIGNASPPEGWRPDPSAGLDASLPSFRRVSVVRVFETDGELI